MKTTKKIRLDEYDLVNGLTECVHFDYYELPDLSERTIKRFLAEGDYSEGGSERYVEVYFGDDRIGSWSAPEIRRSAAAIRAAAKRTGKAVVTGC